jgi:uncharacterized membrane protein
MKTAMFIAGCALSHKLALNLLLPLFIIYIYRKKTLKESLRCLFIIWATQFVFIFPFFIMDPHHFLYKAPLYQNAGMMYQGFPENCDIIGMFLNKIIFFTGRLRAIFITLLLVALSGYFGIKAKTTGELSLYISGLLVLSLYFMSSRFLFDYLILVFAPLIIGIVFLYRDTLLSARKSTSYKTD